MKKRLCAVILTAILILTLPTIIFASDGRPTIPEVTTTAETIETLPN